MSEIAIRCLHPDDAALAVHTLARLKPPGERGDRVSDEDPARLFLRRRSNVMIAATDAGQPVGYAIAYVLERADRTEPMLLLYEIEVAPGRRRLGVGRAMIERLKLLGGERGVFKMWVLTNHANRAARALYGASGGRESGENLLVEWGDADLAAQTSEAAPSFDNSSSGVSDSS